MIQLLGVAVLSAAAVHGVAAPAAPARAAVLESPAAAELAAAAGSAAVADRLDQQQLLRMRIHAVEEFAHCMSPADGSCSNQHHNVLISSR